MSKFEEYSMYIWGEAGSILEELRDELIESAEQGDALSEMVESKVMEWVDSDFIYADLRDCADILDQSDNVERDSGLWDGEDPIDAIKTQALYTYRGDLLMEAIEYVKILLEAVAKDHNKAAEALQEENSQLDVQLIAEESDGAVRNIEIAMELNDDQIEAFEDLSINIEHSISTL